MHFKDHVHAEGLVFHTNVCDLCRVIATMRRVLHNDIRQIIAERQDRAWSLPGFCANNKYSGGSSSGFACDD